MKHSKLLNPSTSLCFVLGALALHSTACNSNSNSTDTPAGAAGTNASAAGGGAPAAVVCTETNGADAPEIELPSLTASVMAGTATTVASVLPADLRRVEALQVHATDGWAGRAAVHLLSNGSELELELVLQAEVAAKSTSELQVVFDGFAGPECGERRRFRVNVSATLVTSRSALEVTSFERPLETRVERQPDGSGLVQGEVSLLLQQGQDASSAETVVAEAGGVIVGGSALLGHYQVRFPSEEARIQGEAKLAADSHVQSVRRFAIDEGSVSATPSEWAGVPAAPFTDGAQTVTLGAEQVAQLAVNHRAMKLPDAWDLMTGATSDVDVMILDSHIYPFHDQLRSTSGSFATHLHNPGISSAEIWAHRTADNRPIFHGTHVAGAACGRGNDGNGTHGTAWGCRLHVFDAATGPNTVDFNLALWATTFQKLPGGAPKVVNMSMNQQRGSCAEAASGGFDPDGPEAKEWRKFFSAFPDTLFVIAAGNCGIPLRNANGNYPLLPASLAADDRSFFSNVIPVVNVDVTDETNWSLSNTTNHIVPRISLVLPETGIGAPGTAIWSTAHACDASGKNCQLGYAPQTGTSVAAAQISGIAALMKQLEPRASAIELQHCLQRSGEYQLVKRPKSGPQDNAVTALVDAQDALDCIRYTHSACQPPESANCAVFPQAYCEDSPEAGEICPAELPPKEIDTFYLGPAHQKRAWGCECLRLGCRPEAGSTFASHPETKASTWESMGCEKPN